RRKTSSSTPLSSLAIGALERARWSDSRVVQQPQATIGFSMQHSKLASMQKTTDVNIIQTRVLPSPAALLAEVPSHAHAEFVARARREIHRLIFTDDKRFLLIVGPCSIHDVEAGRVYAQRLAELARSVADRVMIAMRVYFEKPRTTVGWKGLIMDPHLDGS